MAYKCSGIRELKNERKGKNCREHTQWRGKPQAQLQVSCLGKVTVTSSRSLLGLTTAVIEDKSTDTGTAHDYRRYPSVIRAVRMVESEHLTQYVRTSALKISMTQRWEVTWTLRSSLVQLEWFVYKVRTYGGEMNSTTTDSVTKFTN